MAKPSTLPKFADLDLIDPDSGQPNVVEPVTELKDYGWKFKQFPPRQYFNWIHRWTYKWIKYLNEFAMIETYLLQDTTDGSGAYTKYLSALPSEWGIDMDNVYIVQANMRTGIANDRVYPMGPVSGGTFSVYIYNGGGFPARIIGSTPGGVDYQNKPIRILLMKIQ